MSKMRDRFGRFLAQRGEHRAMECPECARPRASFKDRKSSTVPSHKDAMDLRHCKGSGEPWAKRSRPAITVHHF